MESVCRQASCEILQRELTAGEIGQIAAELLDPGVPDEAKSAVLEALATRGETAQELAGFAKAYLPEKSFELKGSILRRGSPVPLLDVCGTGGGSLALLNISTGMMFLLGAMGVPVVKHGNRAVTKSSGSADVLEALGIKIDLQPGQWKQCLDRVGVTFIFAPSLYASFAQVAPVRRALAAQGKRTIFNLLGPLLNPARPEARLVGVFRYEHLRLYHQALCSLGCQLFHIVCGHDRETLQPLGEVSAYAITEMIDQTGELKSLAPLFQPGRNAQIHTALVIDAVESAAQLERILCQGECGLGRDLILANTAVAAWTQGATSSLGEGLDLALDALRSGAAASVLRQWRDFSLELRG